MLGRAADVIGHPCQGISGARHIHAHDRGAVAGQDARDLCADPPRRSGHDRHLLGERALPVDLPTGGCRRRADLDDLAIDIRRSAGEEEPQRCGKIGDTGVGDIDEVCRSAGTHFFSHRPHDAGQRRTCRRLSRLAARQRWASDEQDAGVASSVRSSNTAETEVDTCLATGMSHSPPSNFRTSSASEAKPCPSTNSAPGVSRAPGRCRRSTAGVAGPTRPQAWRRSRSRRRSNSCPSSQAASRIISTPWPPAGADRNQFPRPGSPLVQHLCQ